MNQLNEIQRMQRLAGILTEAPNMAFDKIRKPEDNPNTIIRYLQDEYPNFNFDKYRVKSGIYSIPMKVWNRDIQLSLEQLRDIKDSSDLFGHVYISPYSDTQSYMTISIYADADNKVDFNSSYNTDDTQELEEKKKARFMKKTKSKPAAAPAKPMAPMPRLAPMPRATKPEAPKSSAPPKAIPPMPTAAKPKAPMPTANKSTPPIPPKPVGPAPTGKGANPSQKGIVQQGIKKAFDAMLAKDPSLKSAITMNATNDGIQISYKPAPPTFGAKKPSTPPPIPKKM